MGIDSRLSNMGPILWQDLVKISSSPGGKHPKAIVAINKNTGDVVSGQGTIPEGFSHYILKYNDDSVYPSAKLEYVYYRMAIDAGIDMMPSELKTYEGETHFLTERFDRDRNDKIHVQTLAAMLPTCTSYEDSFSVIRRLNLPYEDNRQQFLRMVFNVLTRNVDDHSKNFSFCMNKKGTWGLSPAYDLTFSVDLGAPAYVNRHSLTINGKDENINREDLKIVGRKNDIQDPNTLIDKVAQATSRFKLYAREVEIDELLIENILNSFVKI